MKCVFLVKNFWMAPQNNFQKTWFVSVFAPKKPEKWPNFQNCKIRSNVKFHEESDGDVYFAHRSLEIRFSGHFLKIYAIFSKNYRDAQKVFHQEIEVQIGRLGPKFQGKNYRKWETISEIFSLIGPFEPQFPDGKLFDCP